VLYFIFKSFLFHFETLDKEGRSLRRIQNWSIRRV
jgi:hypothetical protein